MTKQSHMLKVRHVQEKPNLKTHIEIYSFFSENNSVHFLYYKEQSRELKLTRKITLGMTTTFYSMILILCEKLEIGKLNKNKGDFGKGKGYEAKVRNYGEAHTTLYSLNEAICTRSSGLCAQ